MVNANYIIGGLLQGAGKAGIQRGTDLRNDRLIAEKRAFDAQSAQAGRDFTAGENQKTRDAAAQSESDKANKDFKMADLKFGQQIKLLNMQADAAMKKGDKEHANALQLQANQIQAQKDLAKSQQESVKETVAMKITSSEKIASLNNEEAANRLAAQLSSQKEALKAKLEQADYAERNKINLKLMDINAKEKELSRKIQNENWQLKATLNANRDKAEMSAAATLTAASQNNGLSDVNTSEAYNKNLQAVKGLAPTSPANDPLGIR